MSYIFSVSGALQIGVRVYSEDVMKITVGEESDCVYESVIADGDLSAEVNENEEYITVESERIVLFIDKTTADLKFFRKCGASGKTVPLLMTYPGNGYERREDGSFCLRFAVTDKEGFYGLGEDNDISFGRLNRRGTIRDMLTGQRINQNHVTADYPVPFLLSDGNNVPYALYLDNTYRIRADIAETQADLVSFDVQGGACSFYLIGGESIPQVHENYSALIGRAKLPPLWVLGFMQSKCSFWDWDELDDAIESFISKGVPLDSVVFDFDWAEYFNNYKWNPRWKGLSPEKIKYYREKYGIHFMASNSGPMLKKDSDTYASALEAGILARDTDGKTVVCGHYSGDLMDFSNPAIKPWLRPQLERIMDDGIEGWWLDLTEPEGEAENTVFFKGSKAEVHNAFSNMTSEVYHDIMREYAPGKRSFVLTRTGTAGIRRNPTAVWTGDIYSEYGTLAAHVPEALNTGLSGIPMWTCDTGGFLSPTNSSECPYNLYHNDRAEHGQLMERWMQFSCFTPITRAHHAGGEAVMFRYQDIMVDGVSHYIKLRYRLLPYIYNLYRESFESGAPIMRPLFWHFPDDEAAREISDEYLFGDSLLIAPVLSEHVCEREVYFPEGLWYDYDYNYVYEGGRKRTVYAPQNRIPVFVRAGSIIPMCGSIKNTREIDFKKLELDIYPAGRSEITVYKDDGETERYLNGEYTKLGISCTDDEFATQVVMSDDNNKYPTGELILHIHTDSVPEKVELLYNVGEINRTEEAHETFRYKAMKDCEAGSYYFDEFNRLLHVKVKLGEGEELCVKVSKSGKQRFEPFRPYSADDAGGQLPYIYPPAALPCRIQAIHYNRGGEGVAYHKHEVSSVNYRDDNAGIMRGEENLKDLPDDFFVGGLESGEWINYTVDVRQTGSYRVSLKARSEHALVSIAVNSQIVTGRITVSSAEFDEITVDCISLTEGEQVIRVNVHEGSLDYKYLCIE